MIKGDWFPLPNSFREVFLLNNFDFKLSETFLFDVLKSDSIVELRDKVAVLSGDGSGKSTARIISIENYIIKTDLALKQNDFKKLEKELSKKVCLANKLNLHHPSKEYFIIEHGGWFYPCSVCDRLKTIHTVDSLSKRLAYFIELVKIGIYAIKEHGFELDLNPSNFAFDEYEPEKLYYIDDEVYDSDNFEGIGSFIIHRIRHESDIDESLWIDFSDKLKKELSLCLSSYQDLSSLIHGIESFPLSTVFHEKRKILLNALNGSFLNKKRTIVSSEKTESNIDIKDIKLNNFPNSRNCSSQLPLPPTCETYYLSEPKPDEVEKPNINPIFAVKDKKITCILSDIHSNLPALQSVLEEAKKLGVTHYIILGDIVGYGPFPNETIEVIANLPNTTIIQGNHDFSIGTQNVDFCMGRLAKASALWTMTQLSQDKLDWLKNLKTYYLYDNYMLLHGSVIDPNYFYGYIYEMTYEENLKKANLMNLNFILYGHTHVPYVYYMIKEKNKYIKQNATDIHLFQDGKVFLINPGSVGQPRDNNNKASFAIWDENDILSFHRVEYPIEETTKKIKELNLFDDLVLRLEIGK